VTERAVVLCLPRGTAAVGPLPERTAERGIRLLHEWDDAAVAVVGWSSGGWQALELAAAHPTVERLVLASTPFPDVEPDSVDLDAVRAKTLLLFGARDPETGSRHGRRWQQRLSNARLEMVPGAGHDLLPHVWPRILSHVAPRRT